MKNRERLIVLLLALVALLCVAAGTAADAAKSAAPYHCGTMCKFHDKTNLSWRDLNDSDQQAERAPADGESQTKTYEGIKIYVPSQYQEDQAHEWAESHRQEDERQDEESPLLGLRKNVRCALYRMEYIERHGTSTPRPLRHLRGCDKWTHDHFYWQRRALLINLAE